jgi:hypothetical protein
VSLNSVVSDFQTLFNRDDCSDAQAQTFVLQGISRIQRDCRLPSMERSLLITPSEAMQFFMVPTDLIQPIDVLVLDQDDRWRALDKRPYREVIRLQNHPIPIAYARMQTQIWLGGAAADGQQVNFLYYGNFSPFDAAGDDDNELTASTPDLALYCALSYAGDQYEHPATDRWEARYQAIKAEVIQMAIDLDAEGGPQYVQSVYPPDGGAASIPGPWAWSG